MAVSKIAIRFLCLVTLFVMSTGCANVEYVDNGDLQDFYASNAKMANLSSNNGKNFGALRFTDSKLPHDEQTLFVLKKHNGQYLAESPIRLEKRNDSTFDRAFFSIGGNHKNRSVGIQFRFEY